MRKLSQPILGRLREAPSHHRPRPPKPPTQAVDTVEADRSIRNSLTTAEDHPADHTAQSTVSLTAGATCSRSYRGRGLTPTDRDLAQHRRERLSVTPAAPEPTVEVVLTQLSEISITALSVSTVGRSEVEAALSDRAHRGRRSAGRHSRLDLDHSDRRGERPCSRSWVRPRSLSRRRSRGRDLALSLTKPEASSRPLDVR